MTFRSFLLPRRITGRTVLWGLVPGFAVVIVLLGLAVLVAMQHSREIRVGTEALVKEQLRIARLLNEVQAEEDALALALHRLVTDAGMQNRRERLQELVEADRAVARLAEQASGMPDGGQWRQLAKATEAFTREASQAFDGDSVVAPERIEGLFDRHEAVVRLIHRLIIASSRHLIEGDEVMNRRLSEMEEESAWILGSCLVLAALCAVGSIAYVRRSIERIEWQTDELNRVSWHMLQTQEETARRFSHELHDELGQALAAIRANLVARHAEDWEERRQDCVAVVDEAIANVRELSQLLRPVILDDFGLEAGLRWLLEKFGQRTRMRVEFESGLTRRPDADVETHLFRIAQEALTNVARHSQAGCVRIWIGEEGRQWVLQIEDDGRGIDPERQEAATSLGLIGMRARARQCGGTLWIEGVEPHGLRLRVVIPQAGPQEVASP